MGDTTGAGTPASIAAMLEATKKLMPIQHIAAHLHDTYGQVNTNSCIGEDYVMALVNTHCILPGEVSECWTRDMPHCGTLLICAAS